MGLPWRQSTFTWQNQIPFAMLHGAPTNPLLSSFLSPLVNHPIQNQNEIYVFIYWIFFSYIYIYSIQNSISFLYN